MENLLNPLNLVLVAAAIFVAWRLFSALGTRTGLEKPPFEPASQKGGNTSYGNEPPAKQMTLEAGEPVWKGHAPEGSPLAAGLEAIAAAQPDFTVSGFLSGARLAYELVLEAYAKGDRKGLKSLVSKDVLDGFSSAIESRTQKGERMQLQFVGIKKAMLTHARLDGKKAQATVDFTGEMISATLNSKGDPVEGDPNHVRDVQDVWTFERDVSSRDPNWVLVDTAGAGR